MIAVIDLETTGTDATHDRAVSLGVVKLCPLTWTVGETAEFRFNPQMQMRQEVIDVHGITNEMAKTYPPFSDLADPIFKMLDGHDIGGFNLFGLDLPILWNEFNRCGYLWEPLKRNIIDAGSLFKKREERSLSAAVKFYCDRDHEDAHSAACDALETAKVLIAQMHRYKLQDMPLPLVQDESLFNKPLDVAGKIITGADGRPTFTFQKVRDRAVADEVGFAEWLLNKDFHPDTKRIVRNAIGDVKVPDDYYEQYQGEEMQT